MTRHYATDDLDTTRTDLLADRLVGYVTHELRLDPRHQHDSHAERRQAALKAVSDAMREVER